MLFDNFSKKNQVCNEPGRLIQKAQEGFRV